MLQNAYLVAKIGADTAENEQHFAEILPTDALRRLRTSLAPGAVPAARGRAGRPRGLPGRSPRAGQPLRGHLLAAVGGSRFACSGALPTFKKSIKILHILPYESVFTDLSPRKLKILTRRKSQKNRRRKPDEHNICLAWGILCAPSLHQRRTAKG